MDLFLGEELPFVIHPHEDANVSVNSKDNKGLLKVFKVLQVLVEVRHARWHDNSHNKPGDAVFVNRKRYDLVWLVRHSKRIKTCHCHAGNFKNYHQVYDVVMLNKVGIEAPEDTQVSDGALKHSEPNNCEQLSHDAEIRGDVLEVVRADHEAKQLH